MSGITLLTFFIHFQTTWRVQQKDKRVLAVFSTKLPFSKTKDANMLFSGGSVVFFGAVP